MHWSLTIREAVTGNKRLRGQTTQCPPVCKSTALTVINLLLDNKRPLAPALTFVKACTAPLTTSTQLLLPPNTQTSCFHSDLKEEEEKKKELSSDPLSATCMLPAFHCETRIQWSLLAMHFLARAAKNTILHRRGRRHCVTKTYGNSDLSAKCSWVHLFHCEKGEP